MVPPMARRLTSVHLKSELETQKFAFALSTLLQKEDILLLSGEIGAGKSFVARAIIQSLQAEPEDVPSPTFTLVQTYDTRLGRSGMQTCIVYRLSTMLKNWDCWRHLTQRSASSNGPISWAHLSLNGR